MSVTTSEIIKEYIFWVDGLNHRIRGRVLKQLVEGNLVYYWEISHYYKPTKNAATAYRPSRRSSDTFEDAQQSLLSYATLFTNIGIEPDNYY